MSKTLDRLQGVVEAATPGVDLLAAALARLGDWPSHDRIEPQRFRIAADLNAALLDAGYAVAPVEARNTYPEALAVVRAAANLDEAQRVPAYSWVIESQAARDEGRPNREVERMDRINAARLALRAALAAFDEAATRSLP